MSDFERESKKHLRRPVAALLVSVAVAVASVVGGAAPAHAATAGWYYIETDGTAGWDGVAYYNSYGRITQLWADLNNRGGWDSLARDLDGNGYMDEFWFDTYEGGGWDALVFPDGHAFTNLLGGSSYYSVVDPSYGITWRAERWLYANVGPSSPNGTTALLLTMARFTGGAV